MLKLKVDCFFNYLELAKVLEIELDSAKELLEGEILFRPEELICLAEYKGISVNELIGENISLTPNDLLEIFESIE